MKNKLKVLITNNTLGQPAGSELYVHDIAVSLLKLGHKPVAYSSELGEIAARLRLKGVPVIDRLELLGEPPDIIHGHHHLDALAAMLYFPKTPAIYYCHGWLPWEESPLRFPRIIRYVAVNQLAEERLISEGGIAKNKVHKLLNFVDLNRFKRRAPLPTVPKRALAFSNRIDENEFATLKEACLKAGIETVDKIGLKLGVPHSYPEQRLGMYDLIFAKGRAAHESLAVGAAVISCDGHGSMVTMANLARQRQSNFGLTEVKGDFTVDSICAEIQKYNSIDADLVCTQIRKIADKNLVVHDLVALYEEVIAEYAEQPAEPLAEYRAVSEYLRWIKSTIQKNTQLHLEIKQRFALNNMRWRDILRAAQLRFSKYFAAKG